MTEKTRKHDPMRLFEVEDAELRATLEEYLEVEPKGPSFWNISTVSGLVMIFLAMSVLVQSLTGSFGLQIGPDFTGILNILPVFGGVLLALVGFGFVASEKTRKKKMKNHLRRERKGAPGEDPLDSFLYPGGGKESRRKGFGAEETDANSSEGFRDYIRAGKKKLFKSRSDKKIAGVCGGLANYFGISSTMVRLIFVISALFGYGSFLIVYIGLAIALPREPVFDEDFVTRKMD